MTEAATPSVNGRMAHKPWEKALGLKRNQLNNKQTFQLAQAILSEKDRIERDRPSKEKLATELSERLGFAVTKGNVLMAAEVAGVSWTAKAARPATPGKTRRGAMEARIEVLERQVAELRAGLGVGA